MAEIYVVDDEPLLLQLMSNFLGIDGHKTKGFSSAAECWSVLSAAETKPELLITDVHLRPISGLQLTESLRIKYSHLPFILMTGDSALADILRRKHGMYAVLEKPFTASDLRTCVMGALRSGFMGPIRRK